MVATNWPLLPPTSEDGLMCSNQRKSEIIFWLQMTQNQLPKYKMSEEVGYFWDWSGRSQVLGLGYFGILMKSLCDPQDWIMLESVHTCSSSRPIFTITADPKPPSEASLFPILSLSVQMHSSLIQRRVSVIDKASFHHEFIQQTKFSVSSVPITTLDSEDTGWTSWSPPSGEGAKPTL